MRLPILIAALQHLDEMAVRIAGKRMYLWRAVDHQGEVLDMLVQRRRDKWAAVRLMRKLLKKQGFTPKLLTTDKLGSHGSAFLHLPFSQLDPPSASSASMPPSTTHSICYDTSSHGQRCGPPEPKRLRSGTMPS